MKWKPNTLSVLFREVQDLFIGTRKKRVIEELEGFDERKPLPDRDQLIDNPRNTPKAQVRDVIDGKSELLKAIEYVKTQPSTYLDLIGRQLVDAAITIIVGHLFLGQAVKNERKQRVARRFIETGMPVLRMKCEQILSRDTSALDEYEILAGPIPSTG